MKLVYKSAGFVLPLAIVSAADQNHGAIAAVSAPQSIGLSRLSSQRLSIAPIPLRVIPAPEPLPAELSPDATAPHLERPTAIEPAPTEPAPTEPVPAEQLPAEHPVEAPVEQPVEPAIEQPIEQPLLLRLSLSARRVTLYRGDEKVVSYPVAIGRSGWETPRGKFQVMDMLKDPYWEHPWTGRLVPPGPSNPLGDRWISFWSDGKNFIGFHGTTQEHLIGQAVSHGCVRMKNRDIRSLFEKVTVGTKVIVEP